MPVQKLKEHSKNVKLQAGCFAIAFSVKQAARVFDLPTHVVSYWKKKAQNPHYRSNSHGGARNVLFKPHERLVAEQILILSATSDPTRKISDYVNLLKDCGFPVGREWVRLIFKKFGYSWKLPRYKQIQKFTAENMEYYLAFLFWITKQDVSKFKYMDEVHFGAFDLSRNRVLGRRGEPVCLLRSERIDVRYSASCLVSLTTPDPLYVALRQESNNAMDFLKFIVDVVDEGFLEAGDTLILDNAPVHKAKDILPILQTVLDELGIRIVFLPCYSPELNPIELVFMKVKRHLREYRDTSIPIVLDIAIAFGTITRDDVATFYRKCLTL